LRDPFYSTTSRRLAVLFFSLLSIPFSRANFLAPAIQRAHVHASETGGQPTGGIVAI